MTSINSENDQNANPVDELNKLVANIRREGILKMSHVDNLHNITPSDLPNTKRQKVDLQLPANVEALFCNEPKLTPEREAFYRRLRSFSPIFVNAKRPIDAAQCALHGFVDTHETFGDENNVCKIICEFCACENFVIDVTKHRDNRKLADIKKVYEESLTGFHKESCPWKDPNYSRGLYNFPVQSLSQALSTVKNSARKLLEYKQLLPRVTDPLDENENYKFEFFIQTEEKLLNDTDIISPPLSVDIRTAYVIPVFGWRLYRDVHSATLQCYHCNQSLDLKQYSALNDVHGDKPTFDVVNNHHIYCPWINRKQAMIASANSISDNRRILCGYEWMLSSIQAEYHFLLRLRESSPVFRFARQQWYSRLHRRIREGRAELQKFRAAQSNQAKLAESPIQEPTISTPQLTEAQAPEQVPAGSPPTQQQAVEPESMGLGIIVTEAVELQVTESQVAEFPVAEPQVTEPISPEDIINEAINIERDESAEKPQMATEVSTIEVVVTESTPTFSETEATTDNTPVDREDTSNIPCEQKAQYDEKECTGISVEGTSMAQPSEKPVYSEEGEIVEISAEALTGDNDQGKPVDLELVDKEFEVSDTVNDNQQAAGEVVYENVAEPDELQNLVELAESSNAPATPLSISEEIEPVQSLEEQQGPILSPSDERISSPTQEETDILQNIDEQPGPVLSSAKEYVYSPVQNQAEIVQDLEEQPVPALSPSNERVSSPVQGEIELVQSLEEEPVPVLSPAKEHDDSPVQNVEAAQNLENQPNLVFSSSNELIPSPVQYETEIGQNLEEEPVQAVSPAKENITSPVQNEADIVQTLDEQSVSDLPPANEHIPSPIQDGAEIVQDQEEQRAPALSPGKHVNSPVQNEADIAQNIEEHPATILSPADEHVSTPVQNEIEIVQNLEEESTSVFSPANEHTYSPMPNETEIVHSLEEQPESALSPANEHNYSPAQKEEEIVKNLKEQPESVLSPVQEDLHSPAQNEPEIVQSLEEEPSVSEENLDSSAQNETEIVQDLEEQPAPGISLTNDQMDSLVQDEVDSVHNLEEQSVPILSPANEPVASPVQDETEIVQNLDEELTSINDNIGSPMQNEIEIVDIDEKNQDNLVSQNSPQEIQVDPSDIPEENENTTTLEEMTEDYAGLEELQDHTMETIAANDNITSPNEEKKSTGMDLDDMVDREEMLNLQPYEVEEVEEIEESKEQETEMGDIWNDLEALD